MYIGIHVKYSLFVILVKFWWTSNFLDGVLKKKTHTQISDFMEIRPMGAEFFYADRRTDGRTDRHDEVNSRFLANTPEKERLISRTFTSVHLCLSAT